MAFNQVIASRDNLNYEQRILLDINADYSPDPSVMGPLLTWLTNITYKINETLESMVVRIFNVLMEKHTKKRSLVFTGHSDAGKSTFANILSAYYERFKIGYFSCPGKNTSTFWLSKLPANRTTSPTEKFEVSLTSIVKTLFGAS